MRGEKGYGGGMSSPPPFWRSMGEGKRRSSRKVERTTSTQAHKHTHTLPFRLSGKIFENFFPSFSSSPFHNSNTYPGEIPLCRFFTPLVGRRGVGEGAFSTLPDQTRPDQTQVPCEGSNDGGWIRKFPWQNGSSSVFSLPLSTYRRSCCWAAFWWPSWCGWTWIPTTGRSSGRWRSPPPPSW